METLANDKGHLNRQLLAKTRGITLLWYLLWTEVDFLFFGIAGFTAISLLYVKEIIFFVLRLFRLVNGDTSDSDQRSGNEDCLDCSKSEESDTETENQSERSFGSEDSSDSSKLEESDNEAEQHSEETLGSEECPVSFELAVSDDEVQQQSSESCS